MIRKKGKIKNNKSKFFGLNLELKEFELTQINLNGILNEL